MTDVSNNAIFQHPSSRMETMSKQLGFDIPVEQVSLPSEGKLYAADHQFCNAATVEIRSMTAREEDLLTSSALHKNGTVINKLIEACLLNKSVDCNALLTGDRDALMFAIRIVGYGSEYKVNATCPKCDGEFAHTFNLSHLEFKKLGAEPVAEGINRFEYKLPLSKVKVEFRLLTVGDEREINMIEEKKRKLGNLAESLVTTRLFHHILSINGEEDRQKIQTVVNNLRAGDSRALRNYIAKISPRVVMAQEADCPKCGETSEVDMPLGTSFFWPEWDE